MFVSCYTPEQGVQNIPWVLATQFFSEGPYSGHSFLVDVSDTKCRTSTHPRCATKKGLWSMFYKYSETRTKDTHGLNIRECSFEKCWGGPENGGGGGGMQIPYWIWGGPSKFRIGFGGGGGHVNSAYVEKSP